MDVHAGRQAADGTFAFVDARPHFTVSAQDPISGLKERSAAPSIRVKKTVTVVLEARGVGGRVENRGQPRRCRRRTDPAGHAGERQLYHETTRTARSCSIRRRSPAIR
jgi:hypothetical protein